MHKHRQNIVIENIRVLLKKRWRIRNIAS